MKVDFENIDSHTIPMTDFPLKWRFTQEAYDKIPYVHLNKIRPLDKEASKYLWDYISQTGLHKDAPFKKDFFRTK